MCRVVVVSSCDVSSCVVSSCAVSSCGRLELCSVGLWPYIDVLC